MDLRSVAPGSPLGDYFRRFWLPFSAAADLPTGAERPMRVQLLGERLVAFRDGQGRLGVVDGLCPHQRGDLFFSTIDDEGIRCNYHGWKFDVTGACIETPMHPDGYGLDTLAYPVAEHAGLLWTFLGYGDPPPLPDVPAASGLTSERRARPWLDALTGELTSQRSESVEYRSGQIQLMRDGVTVASFGPPGVLTRVGEPHLTFVIPADEKATVVLGGRNAQSDGYKLPDAFETAVVQLVTIARS